MFLYAVLYLSAYSRDVASRVFVWWAPSLWLNALTEVLRNLLAWPANCIWIAILFFSIQEIFPGRLTEAIVSAENALQPVSPKRLLILFVLALLVILTGVASIRGLLFAWWLGPWGFWSWSS